MNKILTTIESVINDAVNNYISVISENYNIDAKELKNLWDNNKSDDTKSVASKTSTKSVASKTSTKSSVAKAKNDVTCIYKYIKGKQEGQLCGKNAKLDSNYCTKHLKFETDGQKEKKSIIPKEEVVKVSKVEKCIRYNKEINRWWHQETKLIFKSNLDKVVVGIYRNDNIEKLNDDDCNVCEKYGFKYTKNEVDEPKKSVEPVKKMEEPKKSVEPVKKIEEPKKVLEPVIKKVEAPKKSVEPVKKVEAPKVVEPVKKIEEPKKTVKKVEEPKKKISEQIIETNYYAKNVEDVIGDMLNEVDGDEEDEDDHDTLEDEVLDDFDEEEEELLEEDEE
jgi:hypothetical protein